MPRQPSGGPARNQAPMNSTRPRSGAPQSGVSVVQAHQGHHNMQQHAVHQHGYQFPQVVMPQDVFPYAQQVTRPIVYFNQSTAPYFYPQFVQTNNPNAYAQVTPYFSH